jgi:hypothetical protein
MERASEEHRRLLDTLDEQWAGKSLEDATLPVSLQVNARHAAQILLDKTAPQRATKVAAFAEQLIDTTLAARITEPVACAKGCHYCCHTYVSATIPEIFRVAQAIRAKQPKVARALAAAARAKIIPQILRETKRIDCPILEDGACSEYLDRPVVCRSVLSRSLETCVRIFEQGSRDAFAHAGKSADIRLYVAIVLQSSLILNNLPHQHYDFLQGLEVALAAPDTEERWLAGEPLFAGVPIDTGEAAAGKLAGIVRKVVEVVRPTL